MVASQLEFFEVPSPCIGICQSDEKGYCKGCFRTRDERQNWLAFSADDKQKVIKRCQQRKKRKSAIKTAKPEVADDADKQQPSLFDPPKPKVKIDKDMDFSDFDL